MAKALSKRPEERHLTASDLITSLSKALGITGEPEAYTHISLPPPPARVKAKMSERVTTLEFLMICGDKDDEGNYHYDRAYEAGWLTEAQPDHLMLAFLAIGLFVLTIASVLMPVVRNVLAKRKQQAAAV